MKSILAYIKSHRLLFLTAFCVGLLLSTITFIALSCNHGQRSVDAQINNCASFATTLVTLEIPPNDEPILYKDVTYIEPENDLIAKEYIDHITSCVEKIEDACINGYYTDNAINNMYSEIERLKEIKRQLQDDIDKIARWKEEHYYAAMTWLYLREHGYSKAASAGIIGNMMAETSGGSLDLIPTARNGRWFYGLCQWSLYYRPNVANMSFEEQLEYLHNDIPNEFGLYGYIYKKGFNYESFMKMDDPEASAAAFAKVYERGSSNNYTVQKRYTMKAYEYFTCE